MPRSLHYVIVALSLLIRGVDAFQSFHHQQGRHAPSITTINPVNSRDPLSQHNNDLGRRRHYGTTTRSSTRLYVFERMSTDSINAIMAAQEQTSKLQLPAVGTEVMMAGCINQPGTRALDRTLQKYSLTWRTVQRTLGEMYDSNDEKTNDKGWLSGFRAAKDDDDRPFSPELKQAFVRAGRLADQMSSTQIEPHHIFLALLEFDETGDIKTAATIDENDFCKAGGWAVLVKMNTFDRDQVKALDVCQSLLDFLAKSESSSTERELVTGVGGTTETPTLAECGIDLTQQAQDGLLDPVFGRDKEIRASLRTLIRRRKNNVCLIGEPGVGKVCRDRIAFSVFMCILNSSSDHCFAGFEHFATACYCYPR